MIAALSYFGVLNPSVLLPDKCIFGSGIGGCTDYGFVKGGMFGPDMSAVEAIILNNYGATVKGSAWTIGVTGTSCSSVQCAVSVRSHDYIANGVDMCAGNVFYPYPIDENPGGGLHNPPGAPWPSEEKMFIVVLCTDTGGFKSGERPKIKIKVNATLVGKAYAVYNEGTLAVRVP
jgi:hypothetical protein